MANELMQNRRSVAPNLFNGQPISKEILNQILQNAHRAPTHRLTQPWRFKVLTGEKKNKLGYFLAAKYYEQTPKEKYNQNKYDALPKKAANAGAIILICMQRDAEERIPEWEEVAAVAMAVQNMYLTCTAHYIGCYWSSPGTIKNMGEFIELNEGETCLGVFYMGYYDKELPLSPRNPIETVVNWYE
ncbi:MAG: nitroreductase [Bacteroidetes bacterium]|nr:nitroreductase [Bacteroidota bacterium]